jgi:hypothetical protein
LQYLITFLITFFNKFNFTGINIRQLNLVKMGQTEMIVIVLVVVILLLYLMSAKKSVSGSCGAPLAQSYYVDEYVPAGRLAVESQCRDEQTSLNDRPSFVKRPPQIARIPIQNTIYWQTDKSEDDSTYDNGGGSMNCVSSEKYARANDTYEGFKANLSAGKASRIQFQTDKS